MCWKLGTIIQAQWSRHVAKIHKYTMDEMKGSRKAKDDWDMRRVVFDG